MALDVDKELKIYVYIGLIVLLFYGLWLFIAYETYYAVFGGIFAPGAGRMIGAIYLGWAIAIIRLLKHLDNWEMWENWIIMAVVSTGLNIIISIIDLIVYNAPLLASIITIIWGIFFSIVGIHIIIQKRK